MFFNVHYYCAGGIQFDDNERHSVEIVNTDSTNRYKDKKIYLRMTLTNPIIFLHEIIHAIIDDVDPIHSHHNDGRTTLCSHLDVYTNEAPGFLLDIVNRLEMHFKAHELGNVNYGIHYIPIFAYPSLDDYCMNNRGHNDSDNVSNSPINIDVNDRIMNLPNLEHELVEPPKKIKLEPKEFYKLKFGDEYDVLSKAKGFPIQINKESYVKFNIHNLNSIDNKYK